MPLNKKKLLVVGNSHTQMLSNASAIYCGEQLATIDIEVCWLISRGKAQFGNTELDDVLEKISALKSADLLVLSFLGTMHNITGLFEHENPFSVYAPGETAVSIPAAAEVIPFKLLEAMFDEGVREDVKVKRFAEMAACPVVHLFPPPPKEFFAKSGKVRVVEGKQIEFRFARPDVRLALWKCEIDSVERYLKEIKVASFGPPLKAVDDGGFLLPAFHASDATHANSEYGALLLDEFLKILLKDEIGTVEI